VKSKEPFSLEIGPRMDRRTEIFLDATQIVNLSYPKKRLESRPPTRSGHATYRPLISVFAGLDNPFPVLFDHAPSEEEEDSSFPLITTVGQCSHVLGKTTFPYKVNTGSIGEVRPRSSDSRSG